jgi:1-acyl-sn-glycerol-3-phosphate acyltransferase
MSKASPNGVLNIDPISPEAFWRMLTPMRVYFRPKYYGLDRIDPNKPALLTGNHTLYGALDWPLYTAEIYRQRGVLVRSLTDRAHFRIPYWRDQLLRFGNVEGTPENCAALMRARQHVLVFPGGAREICKRRGEQYKLTWKKRVGFARMAIQHQYPIQPFASVGPDNTYDIVLDADDIRNSRVGKLLNLTGIPQKFLRNYDFIPPICRGLGLTILPRPERFYFMVGNPISTRKYRGKADDEDALWALREQAEDAINILIGRLLQLREQDQDRKSVRALLPWP